MQITCRGCHAMMVERAWWIARGGSLDGRKLRLRADTFSAPRLYYQIAVPTALGGTYTFFVRCSAPPGAAAWWEGRVAVSPT